MTIEDMGHGYTMVVLWLSNILDLDGNLRLSQKLVEAQGGHS